MHQQPHLHSGVLGTLGVHHIALAVHDVDVSAPRYAAHMGGVVELVRDMPDQGVRAASVAHGATGALVELIAPLHASHGAVARFLARRGEGLHHIAYGVHDIHTSLAAARDAGLRLIDDAPRIGLHGNEIAFMHPSAMFGVLTELVQITPKEN
jgi:methylmalonyl-CoA/ethylmalonyl-CoA epimerase